MKGDATLFAREDGVEAAWHVVQPILETSTSLYEYEPNTWGPREADRLIEGGWHNPIRMIHVHVCWCQGSGANFL